MWYRRAPARCRISLGSSWIDSPAANRRLRASGGNAPSRRLPIGPSVALRGSGADIGRLEPVTSGPDQTGQKPIEFLLHDLVALAGLLFEARSIQHGDMTAAVPDQAQGLQLAGRVGHAFAAYTEHVGDQLLRHRQLIRRQPVEAQEQPAAQLL